MAFNLTSKFSDPENILHNMGMLDELGNLLPQKPMTLEPPAKKRHKKIHTKSKSQEIETDYY